MSKRQYKKYLSDDPRNVTGTWIRISTSGETQPPYYTQISRATNGEFNFRDRFNNLNTFRVSGGCYRFVSTKWMVKHSKSIKEVIIGRVLS